jgi:thiamine biosynthesis lipoprotein
MISLDFSVCSIAILLCVQSLLGCASDTSNSTQPVVLKRAQMHMGTIVSITAVSSDRDIAREAIKAGFHEIKRLERMLSTWLPDSELSQVNAEAGIRPVTVSQETYELILHALRITDLTEGGFNIAIGPAVEAWSVTERQDIPGAEDLARLKALVDWREIQMDAEAHTIFLPKAGMRIDVGGIGKGYAADRAIEVMKKAGAQGGVVALSGDIKVFGTLPEGQEFPAGIRHPRDDHAILAMIMLKDQAISTAGDYERYFERDGIRYHHILDPSTLQPARECQSVTVIAADGITADGLDTGIFVMGREKGMDLVERLPGVGAVIIDHEGKMWISSRLRGKVKVYDNSE